MSACATDDELTALARGLPVEESRERHVDGCDSCSVRLAAMRGAPAPALSPTLHAPKAASAAAPPPASVGRYLLVRELGRGAMGQVWLAHDSLLGRHVALKAVGTAGAQLASHITNEARAIARLHHPQVVGLFDVLLHDGHAYLAMEYVDGGDLRAWLETPRDASRVLDVFLECAAGLAAAHDVGVVHRDFKPANVMMGTDGRPRVSDFGLASLRGELDPTAPGAVVGTPAYMAPEQFDGRIAGPATDQFAFCVALHEALTGARPFEGETLAALADAVRKGPSLSPRLPSGFAPLLRRGLSVEPAARFESMQALASALRSAAEAPRRRRRWSLAAVAALALAGVSGVALWPADPCRDAAMSAPVLPWTPGAAPPALSSTLARSLESTVASWKDTWGQQCAARTRGETAALDWQRVQGCLASAKDDVELVAEAARTAPAPQPAEFLLRWVAAPAACVHPPNTPRTRVPVEAAARRSLVDALLSVVDAATREDEQPAQALEAALRAAELATPHAPTRARLLTEVMRYQYNLAEHEEATRTSERARLLAQQNGALQVQVYTDLWNAYARCLEGSQVECTRALAAARPGIDALEDPWLAALRAELEVSASPATGRDPAAYAPVVAAWRKLPGAGRDLARAQRAQLHAYTDGTDREAGLALSFELLPSGAPLHSAADCEVAIERANLLGALGREQDALRELDQAVASARRLGLAPFVASAELSRIYVMYGSGDDEAVVRQPRPVPTNSWFEVARFGSLAHLGRVTEAKAQLDRLVFPLVWGSLPVTEKRSVAEDALMLALATGDKALVVDVPDDELTPLSRANRLTLLGDEAEAREVLRGVPATPPASNFLMRADLAFREGRHADAVAEARRALGCAESPQSRLEAELRQALSGLALPGGAAKASCEGARALLRRARATEGVVLPWESARFGQAITTHCH